MNFLYPSFLWALSAISIPIIIHLFNFRRYKTVYFSNVAYLKNIQEETKSKSQLKHLLILLARIITIIALVLVFAQPYIPLNENKISDENSLVSIYIDNSFSMDAENTYGKLLEVAKNKAIQIADAYKPSTQFLLITNDLKAEDQHLVNKEQLLEKISAIKISPNVKMTSEIIERQLDIMNFIEDKEKYLYLLSDFQISSTEIKNINADSLININLMAINAERASNLYIDSCWFETPARKFLQQEGLFVRIKNYSDEAYQNIPLKLYLNDSLKTPSSFNIKPNDEQIVVLSYQNSQKNIINGKIEITDYPITFDNNFYFNYTIADKIKVLAINKEKPNNNILALFNNDDYIELTNYNLNNINYSAFPGFQTIMLIGIDSISSGLSQELVAYTSNGGTVMFVPSIQGNISSYNKFLTKFNSETFLKLDTAKTKISEIGVESIIFKNAFQKIEKDADMPQIKKHLVFSKRISRNTKSLLTCRNKDAILNYSIYGNGHFFSFSIPFDNEISNFLQHPLFVPTVYNIVLNSNPSNQLYYTIGYDNSIELRNNIEDKNCNLSISNKSLEVDFDPEVRKVDNNINIYLTDEIKLSGNYNLNCNETSLYGIAFNYNNIESEMDSYKIEEVEELFHEKGFDNINILDIDDQFITKSIKKINEGTQLWKYFLMLALLFIIFEILLLRFSK